MMVRHYKSTTNKGNYSADKVDDALHAVRGGMSVKKAVTVCACRRVGVVF